jgi:negative regulator of flagellin synthesis FlgM
VIDYSGLKLRPNLPLTLSTGRSADAGDAKVPNKINGLEPRPVRVAAGNAVAKTGTERTTSETKPHSRPAADVQITGAARSLAAVEQALRDSPAVDSARVAAVRQRLDDGSYQIDPQRIADKLLRMERDLASGKQAK